MKKTFNVLWNVFIYGNAIIGIGSTCGVLKMLATPNGDKIVDEAVGNVKKLRVCFRKK